MHAFKFRKTDKWLWILVFVPGLGSLTYLFVEIVMPWWQVKQLVWQAATPTKVIKQDTKELEQELADNPTFANKVALADAYSQQGKTEEGVELYKRALEGIYTNDIVVLKKLALAYSLNERFPEAVEVWEKLKAAQPRGLKPDEQLAYAKSLDGAGQTDKVGQEYQLAAASYPGLEANYWYMKWLSNKKSDQLAIELRDAKRKYDDLLPRYKGEERKWWEKIKKEFV